MVIELNVFVLVADVAAMGVRLISALSGAEHWLVPDLK